MRSVSLGLLPVGALSQRYASRPSIKIFTEVCLSRSKTVDRQCALPLTFFTGFDFGSAFVLSTRDQLSVCLVPG